MVLYKLLMCLYIDITLCYVLTHFMPLVSFYTPWNIRNPKNKSTRPLVFWWFQEVQKETSGMTWVNEQMVPFVPVSLVLSFHKFLKFLFICLCCILHFLFIALQKGVIQTSARKFKATQKQKRETPMKWSFPNSISTQGIWIGWLWFLLTQEEACNHSQNIWDKL